MHQSVGCEQQISIKFVKSSRELQYRYVAPPFAANSNVPYDAYDACEDSHASNFLGRFYRLRLE